jgi:8-oxo-dGTP pyrophosphatase MutT (NUDIX family)
MPKTKQTYLARLSKEVSKIFEGQAAEQYAAICYRLTPGGEVEVLLVTTRDSKRWIVPKGWAIDKMKPHKIAEREAWEEAGVKGKAKKRAYGYFTYIKSLDTGENLPSVVQVHLLEVKKIDQRFPERGQRISRWLPPFQAATLVREPELKSLLGGVEKAILKAKTR